MIGRGAFGEVHLVKAKQSGKVFALKILNKWEMLKRQETACYREERRILLEARSDFLTTLHCCFQDDNFLYLLMEYYPGGDLLTLMSKQEECFDEDMARFYTAETILAVEAMHGLGYIHRDVKPDNILIERSGHVRLADFGSCAYVGPSGVLTTAVGIGTPDYVSPESLDAMNGKGGYGKETDWWSVGVILYEMLMGEAPFYAESLMGTYAAIHNHKETLIFPEDVALTGDVKDLIRSFLTDRQSRLGYRGTDEIKAHRWFNKISFTTVRKSEPPFVPELQSNDDTSNFDDSMFEDRPPVLDTKEPKRRLAFSGHHLPFIGFSFMPTLFDKSGDTSDGSAVKKLQGQLEAAQAECTRLAKGAASSAAVDPAIAAERDRCDY